MPVPSVYQFFRVWNLTRFCMDFSAIDGPILHPYQTVILEGYMSASLSGKDAIDVFTAYVTSECGITSGYSTAYIGQGGPTGPPTQISEAAGKPIPSFYNFRPVIPSYMVGRPYNIIGKNPDKASGLYTG